MSFKTLACNKDAYNNSQYQGDKRHEVVVKRCDPWSRLYSLWNHLVHDIVFVCRVHLRTGQNAGVTLFAIFSQRFGSLRSTGQESTQFPQAMHALSPVISDPGS